MNVHTLETIGSLLGKTWSVVGPLVGIVIGAWLARSRRLRHWLLASKKAEYRELRREDWEKLRDVLVKMARRDLAILEIRNSSTPLSTRSPLRGKGA
jgi:hypothetical protein